MVPEPLVQQFNKKRWGSGDENDPHPVGSERLVKLGIWPMPFWLSWLGRQYVELTGSENPSLTKTQDFYLSSSSSSSPPPPPPPPPSSFFFLFYNLVSFRFAGGISHYFREIFICMRK